MLQQWAHLLKEKDLKFIIDYIYCCINRVKNIDHQCIIIYDSSPDFIRKFLFLNDILNMIGMHSSIDNKNPDAKVYYSTEAQYTLKHKSELLSLVSNEHLTMIDHDVCSEYTSCGRLIMTTNTPIKNINKDIEHMIRLIEFSF